MNVFKTSNNNDMYFLAFYAVFRIWIGSGNFSGSGSESGQLRMDPYPDPDPEAKN